MSENAQIILPDHVLSFLSDFAAVRFAQEFVKTYGLAEADVPRVMSLAEDVVHGVFDASLLPNEMASQFHFDEAKAKHAAIFMAEKRLLPIQEVVPGIAQQIRMWSGEVVVSTLPEKAPLTPALFVATTFADVLKETPSFLQGRLSHILESYVGKRVDRATATEMFLKPEKVGGMEFDQQDADLLLNYAEEKMKDVVFAHEAVVVPAMKKEFVPVVAKPILKKEPVSIKREIPSVLEKTSEAKEPLVKKDLSRNEEEDTHEIEVIKQTKQTALSTPLSTPKTAEEMVGYICSLEPMQLPDGTLADRCKQIVESRLREVRTAFDTQNQIERSVETGGLGISGRKLADMMQAIEHGVDLFVHHAAEKIAEDKSQYLEKKQTAQLQKTALSQQEEVLMTKRYVELTGKMPEEHIAPSAPISARVSGASSKQDQLDSKEKNINIEKVRSVIEATKKETQQPTSSSVRPTVADVKFSKRLSGPIDELRSMTLVDFRRMAKNANQATEKMIDLVHLVEDQGYDKRVEAVRAWQSSPLYQLYLDIARRAMQEGKPLEDARAEMEKTSETITKEELTAILRLNGELRF